MAEKNLLSILVKRSIEIFKKAGFSGFIRAIKKYYQEYPPLRYHFYYWLKSSLSRSKIIIKEVQGSKMYLDLNDYGLSKHLYFYSIREPECTRIMKQYIKTGMIIVDLGANIGYYALLEAAIMKDKGKIYAIEPFPPNYNLLKKNIELNSYENIIESYNIAISNKSGKDKMYMSKEHNLCNMMQSNSTDFIEVQTSTLDDFLVDKQPPDLIRMDIEGFEYYVIDGMEKTLQNSKSCIMFIEIHPYQIYEKNLDYKKPLQKLFKYGFVPKYVVREYGPLKEEVYTYDGSTKNFFSFLKEKQLTPPEYTHGFGLFLEKK
jgi:FkbM family methyltransferase